MTVMEGPDLVRKKLGTILVVEDDASLRRLTQVQLDKLGYQTRIAADVSEGLDILRREQVELVISDLHLPSESGIDLLRKVRTEYPETKFVIVTAYGSINTAIEAMKSGAYDYLTKPLHPVELRALVERVFEQQRLAEEVQVLRSAVDQKYGFKSLVGESAGLKNVIDLASRAARTDAAVLITGETGTGKELLAKAIHFNSARRDRPFVIVNCGSIPRDLVESELFGHVRGAFTGAAVHKQGRVEMAAGGTLFLDEIGEMPLEMQVRLLRLLQEGEVQKVGATSTIHVDVRIIAATHRNLEELIRASAFREDLYYRLAVVPIQLPPLRQRREDIPELVQSFFRENIKKHHREELRLPASLIGYFSQYDWPGNVRQLANCIVRIIVLAAGPEIKVSDLPDFLQNVMPPKFLPSEYSTSSELRAGDQTLDDVDRQVILEAMERFDWNQTHAARHLGVTRKILRRRLERYGIRKPELHDRPPE
jgi:two-component system NtrC family response regulator